MAKTHFKPDGKQALAVVAMLAAIFTFAAGEIVIGGILIATSAVLSIGGLFWNAHQQDKEEAAERAASIPAPNKPR